jgi:hypothetical protein
MYCRPDVPEDAEKVTGRVKEYVIIYLDQSNWDLSNTKYVGRRQETCEVWLKLEKL